MPSPTKERRHKKTAAGPGRVVSRTIARLTEAILPETTVRRIRKGREWKRWVDSLTPEALQDLGEAPVEVKRRLFRDHVGLVEIETHGKCNRICSFCPNVVMDRRRNEVRAETGMLRRVFEELGSIDYAGQIKVARYSEPLTNVDYLCEQIAVARPLVPRARLAIVTNTDYLTPPVLRRLEDAGLDVVYMSLYLKTREVWTLPLARTYTERLAEKLEARIASRQETSAWVECTFEYAGGMTLQAACRNFDEYGTDRGAVVERYTRQTRVSPCREPFETFVIDYTGAVMPCCNLRSDLPQHKGTVVGDLTAPGASIFDIYAGRLAGWRRSMVGVGPKEFPCATCLHRPVPEDLAGAVGGRLRRRLEEIGRPELTAR